MKQLAEFENKQNCFLHRQCMIERLFLSKSQNKQKIKQKINIALHLLLFCWKNEPHVLDAVEITGL